MDEVEVVIAHGDRAVVRLGDLYLKIEADAVKADREHAAMLAAPVPVSVVAWRHGSVMALRALRGRPLDAGAPPEVWRAVGAAARRVHATPPPVGLRRVFVAEDALHWLRSDRPWLLERGVIDADVFDHHQQVAIDALTGRDVADAFLHGDLQAGHVFIDGDEVTGIIDWADACVGDPMFDLAVLTGMHTSRLDDVLDGYGGGDRDAIRGWWSLRWIGEVRWMLEHGFDATENLAWLRKSAR